MTTIAYDGRYIACDSRLSSDGHVVTDKCEKFHENDDWILFWSGALHQVDLFVNIFMANREFNDEPEVWMIGFNKSTKDVWNIYVKDKKFKKETMKWKDGRGRGACYAIGAMDFGASAAEAVKIAMSRDCSTGGLIRCFDTKTGKFIKVKQ